MKKNVCKPFFGGKLFIYFATFSVSLTAYSSNCCYVWPSSILTKLNSSNLEINPIGRPLSLTESTWLVSSFNLGLISGPIISLFALKVITKKLVLLLTQIPVVMAHIILCFASSSTVFILARILMGIGTGAVWASLGTYIAEIAEDKNRGLLGTVPSITANISSLGVFIVGPYLTIWKFSIFNLVPLIIFYITFGLFVPDTPYDLILNNREEDAKSSLRKFRQTYSLSSIDKELAFIKETVKMGSNKSNMHFSDFFKNRSLRKGLQICIMLMLFQQFSGIVAILSYAETIFHAAGNFIPSEINPIIYGSVSVLAVIISLPLIDKMGRKSLLTASCGIEFISLICLGLYFYLLSHGFNVAFISWLPISSLMLFMFAFNFALGIVPWIITGEVFHSSVKAFASTVTSLSNYSSSFLVNMCFPYLVQSFGMEWTFFIFAIFMFLGFIFCLLVLPETKGKNFQEIQDLLQK